MFGGFGGHRQGTSAKHFIKLSAFYTSAKCWTFGPTLLAKLDKVEPKIGPMLRCPKPSNAETFAHFFGPKCTPLQSICALHFVLVGRCYDASVLRLGTFGAAGFAFVEV